MGMMLPSVRKPLIREHPQAQFMKKQTEKQLAFAVAFVVLAAILFAYIRHETHTLHMNGSTYTFLGMIEQEENGKKFYVPIYKRTN